MGRTGSSLVGRFPPQGGGSSPRQVDPMDGRKTERPLDKMIVVIVEYYYFLINIIVGAPPPRRAHFASTK